MKPSGGGGLNCVSMRLILELQHLRRLERWASHKLKQDLHAHPKTLALIEIIKCINAKPIMAVPTGSWMCRPFVLRIPLFCCG